MEGEEERREERAARRGGGKEGGIESRSFLFVAFFWRTDGRTKFKKKSRETVGNQPIRRWLVRRRKMRER